MCSRGFSNKRCYNSHIQVRKTMSVKRAGIASIGSKPPYRSPFRTCEAEATDEASCRTPATDT